MYYQGLDCALSSLWMLEVLFSTTTTLVPLSVLRGSVKTKPPPNGNSCAVSPFMFCCFIHTLMDSGSPHEQHVFLYCIQGSETDWSTLFLAIWLCPGTVSLSFVCCPWDSSAVITLHFIWHCVRAHYLVIYIHIYVCQDNKIPVFCQIYTSMWLPPSPRLAAYTSSHPTHCDQDSHLTLLTGVSPITHLVSVIWLLTGPGTVLHIGFHIWLQRNLSFRFLWPGC